ncbi:hypothetical protein EI94DRAFT_567200 [Lactarius quietus]|nr:hypothetical protein EI94DRAFT_567200 [Lactarius quietus]
MRFNIHHSHHGRPHHIMACLLPVFFFLQFTQHVIAIATSHYGQSKAAILSYVFFFLFWLYPPPLRFTHLSNPIDPRY